MVGLSPTTGALQGGSSAPFLYPPGQVPRGAPSRSISHGFAHLALLWKAGEPAELTNAKRRQTVHIPVGSHGRRRGSGSAAGNLIGLFGRHRETLAVSFFFCVLNAGRMYILNDISSVDNINASSLT